MWQVERHSPRHVNINIVGDPPKETKAVSLDGFYTIRDSITGQPVYTMDGRDIRKWKTLYEVLDACAKLIELDFPKEVKSAS